MNKIYDGETARNLHVRTKEHLAGMKNKCETNFMYKHKLSEHEENEDVRFRWEVTGKFQKPMQRQLFEALRIENKTEAENLNSKSEYNGHSIKRLTIDKENAFICNVCSYKVKSKNHLFDRKRNMHENFQCPKCSSISMEGKLCSIT